MVKGNLVGQVGQENTNSDTGDVSLAHADVEVDFHVQQPHIAVAGGASPGSSIILERIEVPGKEMEYTRLYFYHESLRWSHHMQDAAV